MDLMILGESSCYDTFLELLTLLALLVIAVMAIFQQRIWSFWRRPRVKLEALTEVRDFVKNSEGQYRYYYWLRIVNSRRRVAVRKCRVLLTGLWDRGPDGKGKRRALLLPAPLQVHWCYPHRYTGQDRLILDRDFRDWYAMDFVHLVKDGPDIALLGVYTRPYSFKGDVKPDKPITYRLQVLAEDFVPKWDQAFEVSWEGGWSDDLELMKKKLVVKDVSGEMKKELRNRSGKPMAQIAVTV